MRCLLPLAAAVAVAMPLVGGHALANVCRTQTMMCATTMPVDGYCECTTHGNTEGGTVLAAPPAHGGLTASAGGCGAHPNSPGCSAPAMSVPPKQ